MEIKEKILKAYKQSPHFNLSFKDISDYINELYMPDTLVFESHKAYVDYRNNLPKYVYDNIRNGAGETGRNVDGTIYAIPEPKDEETEKIERFIKFEDKRKKLVEIIKLQSELFSKDTSRKGLEFFNNLRDKINILFEEVLDIDKQSQEKQKKKKLKVKKQKYVWQIIVPYLVSGQINELQKNEKYSVLDAKEFTRIFIKKTEIPLTVEQVRPYFQSTLFKSNNSPKDLYSENKLRAIVNFCEKESLEIIDNHFLNKIKKYNIDYNS